MPRCRVTGGEDLRLADWAPAGTGDFEGGKSEGPWIVVPANRTWYPGAVICRALIESLEAPDLRDAEPVEDLSGIVIE